MSGKPVSKHFWWRTVSLLPVVIATIVLLSVLPTIWGLILVLVISCVWGWFQNVIDQWGDRTFGK